MSEIRPEHAEYLFDFYRDVLAPPPNLTVCKWIEENVVIPERAGATGGPFDMNLIPYAREPLECYKDKSVSDLVLVFGTQCAKTTIMMAGGMYRICNDPMSCVWVLPNENMAKSFSKTRWIPYLNDCAEMQKQIPRTAKGLVDRYRFGFLEQQFARMNLNFVGSNSPANLASRPAGFLQLDEVDKFGEETDFEAGALDNAEERAKTFPFPLIVKSSTPTTVHGGIWKEFTLSDQRHYYVPCPRCEQRILLKFRVKTEKHGECGVRWWYENEEEVKKNGVWDMEAIRQAAHYKCQECGQVVHDGEKPSMVRSGLWVPHNLEAERGRRGYHLSSLYSLLGPKVTLGAIAVGWCQTRGMISKRHRFINSMLAETWDNEKAVDDRPLFVEDYGQDQLPGERVNIMTIDVQEAHFWVVIRTWARSSPERPHGESWVLVADRVDTEPELVALQEQYGVLGENVIVDMARKPNQVGQMIVRNDWRGMIGSDKKKYPHRIPGQASIERIWSEVQFRDPHLGTEWQDRTTSRARFVYWCKDPVRDLVFALRFEEPTYWHVNSTVHEKYQRHLNAHTKMAKNNPRTNRIEYFWKELHSDDHLLDCECMNATRAVQLGMLPLIAENPQAYQSALGL